MSPNDVKYHNRLCHVTKPSNLTIDAKCHIPIMSRNLTIILLMQSIITDNLVSGDGKNQASVRIQSIITDYHILLQVHLSFCNLPNQL